MDISVFDSWEPIEKARKPKGLANWSRLSHIAEKLEGKGVRDISFTTCYPGQEGARKTLGSIEGNLHFLLGYGSPAFHFAPYHWQVIDPNLDDDEADQLYVLKGHPSRPELWDRAGLPIVDEGDIIHGQPHPVVIEDKEAEKLQALRAEESVRVVIGSRAYTGVPSEGLVYGEHNGHVYLWPIVQSSFLAASNPDFYNAMNDAYQARQAELESLVIHKSIEYPAEDHAKSFDHSVYPLVQDRFPPPGSVIDLVSKSDEIFYGKVTSTSIDFVDREGEPVQVPVFGTTTTSLDLRKGGNTFASVIYNFARNQLGLPIEGLSELVEGFNE